MGGSRGGSQPSTTTNISKSEPPAYIQPYATEYLGRASALSNQPYQPFPGSTATTNPRIAALAPETTRGMQMTMERALSGSPELNAAKAQFGGTMRGDYLNSNPYLDATFGQAARSVTDQYTNAIMPSMTAAASRAGAMGGSAFNEMQQQSRYGLGQNLNNLATDIYGGNYQQERNRQAQMMAQTPFFADQGYKDAQAVLGVGDISRGYNQDIINAQIQDFDAARLQQFKNLDVLGNAINVGSGGSGTTTTTGPNPYRSNPYAGMIGGGLAGYGLSSAAGAANPLLYGGLGALGGGLF